MTKELANFLKNACDEAGINCEVRDDYSGRCMYGEKTYGLVVGRVTDLLRATLEYFQSNIEMGEEDLYYGIEVPDIESLAWDSMGLDTIVY